MVIEKLLSFCVSINFRYLGYREGTYDTGFFPPTNQKYAQVNIVNRFAEFQSETTT